MPVNKIGGTSLSAVSKINAISKTGISYWSGKIITVVPIPTGLIIPFNSDASVPSGWAAFTDADEKYIVGAGSTYAVDATAASEGEVTKTSSSNGAHGYAGSTVANGGSTVGTSSESDHSHTLAYTWTPPYVNARLIKADAGETMLPQNGVVWATSTPEGSLSNIWTDDEMFFASAGAIGTGGTNSITGLSSSSRGSHTHGSSSGAGGGGERDCTKASGAAGGHTHSSLTVTITNTLRRYALSAWQNASADYDLESGFIGMYESVTPPNGWSLCNGSNGTPDLRDYFIQNTTSGSEGASGDGTITATCTLAHSSHQHNAGGSVSNSTCGSNVHGAHTMDSHTINTNYSWLPAYYALAFIMKD
jgi:hypothetical protein